MEVEMAKDRGLFTWLRERWNQPAPLAGTLWILLVLLVGLLYFQHFIWGHLRALVLSPHDLRYALVVNSLVLLLILGGLRWLALVLRSNGLTLDKSQPADKSEPPAVGGGVGEAFPSLATKIVSGWLLLIALVSVIGVFLAINPPSWPSRLLAIVGATDQARAISEALATLFGAGIGATVTTILAFFRHASARKDFDRAWAPWYVARPIMGMLLGLVFFFLIKGGLWATVGADIAENPLNIWSLAGIGAMVGMFSKNAIEKLRELFKVLFKVNLPRDQ
jgi:hypothetical protein